MIKLAKLYDRFFLLNSWQHQTTSTCFQDAGVCSSNTRRSLQMSIQLNDFKQIIPNRKS